MSAHAPAIVLSSLDADRLEQMLDTPPYRDAPGADALRAELERAQVVEPASLPADVVGMNTTAECVDDGSGQRHRLTLVYPRDADAAQGRVSVLAPVGSALLGLRVGQSIDWPAPGGRTLRLRVTAVHRQPEASGQASR
ncbi:GreA/GreB family elongation factor [Mizugakiibacter sediminis]|uniref:GreA/GreB family elongation factor n=1 Tax=Mizugakiibacter sediminis TaxID=1475481 RepID=A0A0K8QNL0_9GAMM|nr:nucleoside diphosphate kinase regulator [Mizugakiibacter sediminis]GAP66007.1 GreA/GreB family elongation factor [Mizugakiibacter sediminis]